MISENGAAACIIDLQADENDPRRAFRFHGGEGADSVVEGFTIRNGFMDRGGAVLCEAGSSPSFIDCAFLENHAETIVFAEGGGAIRAEASSPTISGCLFEGNTATGPEPGSGGAIATWFGAPTLHDCTFDANQSKPVPNLLSMD